MRKRTILIVAGVVVGLLLLTVLVNALSSRSRTNAVRETADSFVAAVLKGDAGSAYRLFSSDAQSNLDNDAWTTTVARLSSNFKGANAEQREASLSGQYYYYKYAVSGNDGDYILSLALVGSGDVWRVQSFKSELQVN